MSKVKYVSVGPHQIAWTPAPEEMLLEVLKRNPKVDTVSFYHHGINWVGMILKVKKSTYRIHYPMLYRHKDAFYAKHEDYRGCVYLKVPSEYIV